MVKKSSQNSPFLGQNLGHPYLINIYYYYFKYDPADFFYFILEFVYIMCTYHS